MDENKTVDPMWALLPLPTLILILSPLSGWTAAILALCLWIGAFSLAISIKHSYQK